MAAESILSVVVESILTKLGSEALRELGLILGMKDEFQRLRDKALAIEAVIRDAEEQQSKSHAIKIWITSLKDAFYDIDDLIDEFSYEKMRRRVITKHRKNTQQVRLFFSKSNQIAFRVKMGHKIRDMMNKLDAINADRTQFNFSERMRDMQDCQLKQRRETHSFIREDEMIGRDDDRNTIIDLLLDTDVRDNVSVIAIVGMGGLGKTALAQYVYNAEKITRHFEVRLWTCVSETFHVKNIIEYALKEKTGSYSIDYLQSELQNKINGKKYLFILDDVWNESDQQWAELTSLLMGGAKGSKILLTTREERVADICRAAKKYLLSSLSEDKSWLLFQRLAFEGGKEPKNKKLIEIGKDIVVKLKGVPLAIRTIGPLLYHKQSEDDWLSFKDNELRTIMKQKNEMKSILLLSYSRLPFYLKQCFTYCALFPKDDLIEKDKLIKQWVAQGFIQPTDGTNKTIEDVGHDYFMELLWRSFFQDTKKNERGEIEYCKIHDLMHDLACSIVGTEYIVPSMGIRSLTTERSTRHMSLILEYDSLKWTELPESLFEAKNLRTLRFEYEAYHDRCMCYYRLISNFLRLRILDLNKCQIKKLPKSIGKLKHLRYIDLSQNLQIKLLPNSITKLYNLETLRLQMCFNLIKLPKDAKNWINLKHLDIIGCGRLNCMPKGLGGLTSLQSLSMFVVRNDSHLSELKRLNTLKGSLCVRVMKFFRDIDYADILTQKSSLRELRLEWDRWEGDYDDHDKSDNHERVLNCLQPHPNVEQLHINGYEGLRFPDWPCSYLHLIRIELWYSDFLQSLHGFHEFPFLKHLNLKFLEGMEYLDNNGSPNSSSTFFPSLETLQILSMYNLKGWWKGENLMESAQTIVSYPKFPRLFELEIGYCSELISFPGLPCLRSLNIHHVTVPVLYTIIERLPRLAIGSSSMSSLKLEEIQDLDFLSEELLSKCSMLESLTIYSCENLKMSAIWAEHLVEGDNADILWENVEGDNADIFWKKLENLRILHLSWLPKIESLPTGLLYLSTLQQISIYECDNLMYLPECMGNLTSLRSIVISGCSKLTSLPKGMHHLTSLSTLVIRWCDNLASLPEEMHDLRSLKSLTIFSCPKLEEGCKENGEEWPKIAHIPNLDLRP